MIERDTIVVGGGPAGSSAAWQLTNQGMQCLVLDREQFPREKLCAGWITPEVLTDLAFEEKDYPHRFLTFDALKVSLWRLPMTLPAKQHSIRRFEFDHWMLERSGAEVAVHNVRHVKPVTDGYEIDGTYYCRNLIGAGGTRCPVYRDLVRDQHPRDKTLQAVALELEYPYDWQDANCYLWFLTDGLPGYSWYVPKADGYLNIGVGGIADKLKHSDADIRWHWDQLIERLRRRGLVKDLSNEPKGYSYFLRDRNPLALPQNLHIIGDSRGLATRDMCEGIGPAVQSGIAAAKAIARPTKTDESQIDAFTLDHELFRRALEWRFLRGHHANLQAPN
jgi:flavin-dependent dehydrogenase